MLKGKRSEEQENGGKTTTFLLGEIQLLVWTYELEHHHVANKDPSVRILDVVLHTVS